MVLHPALDVCSPTTPHKAATPDKVLLQWQRFPDRASSLRMCSYYWERGMLLTEQRRLLDWLVWRCRRLIYYYEMVRPALDDKLA